MARKLQIAFPVPAEGAELPDYVQIIRDVSADPAYKNRALAERIVNEEI